MIFTSFEFLLFFIFVLLIRNSLSSFTVEKWFLLVASYLFYMSWSIPCAGLILLTSLVDYYVGRLLGRVQDNSRRKGLLVISLVANLGVLGFFKYTNFLMDNLWSGFALLGIKLNPVHYNIILPAGISFFTFQSMSYTIDVYRRQIQPCESPRDFLLFVSFFPQLLAGPIVRAAKLLPQLLSRIRASAEDTETGLVLFGMGAIKKIVLSDQIAPHIDVIFAHPGDFDALTLVQGVIGYAVQIYCDFSGYTDMAIGCARMMGYRFPDNFQMPYSSVNITEFWRRWHISLSTWLRDYLYISLGGNRRGVPRMYLNLMITMLLGGLWHGASWNFIIWGAIHGLALAIHKMWTSSTAVRFTPVFSPIVSFCSRCFTLGIVLLGWIFFRSQTLGHAATICWRTVSWSTNGTRLLSPQILAAATVVFLAHLLIFKDRNWAEEIPQRSMPQRILAYTCLAVILVFFGATDASPFIYFQF